MLTWLSANWINMVLAAVIVMAVGLVIRALVRDRKAGKAPCGCSCGGCDGSCAGCSLHGACCSMEKK